MEKALTIEQLDTPVILVDLDILESNLRRTAERAARAGVKLRPHTKTHKSVWIAGEQIRHGAAGITVAKLGEAEVMAEGGIRDILVAFPIVGKQKLERLDALIRKGVTMTVATDDLAVAQGLSDLGEAQGYRVRVYVDVNSGLNRCGREPGTETVELVKRITALPGVEVTGVMTHAGHSYGKTKDEDIRQVAIHEAESLHETKRLLAAEGIDVPEVSVGSTPTSKYIEELTGVTEMRPGAYVFGDGTQLSTGIIDESECAMSVLATVVSHPREGTAIIDGGSKTFSSDLNAHRPGHGFCVSSPEVYIERLSEEHGILKTPPGSFPEVGERLRFLPNHCCATTNLHDTLVGIRNGKVERILSVDARGRVR
ncbi:alanine racemase [Paenibacillus sp. J31TS4]|uniref:alanine racemase n=1 Tax=Paenibacillus sp. J31TS4 TaxID=2807195 RepID=UPI001B14F963|nr:alanine racemase [Paenibacillus sp. J31TS4]GIP37233.1 alanine racemase [Paenibacillus sp. J31TS4]